MLKIIIVLTILGGSAGGPWMASEYVQSGEVVLINNVQYASGTQFFDHSYGEALNIPSVLVSISKIQINLASNYANFYSNVYEADGDGFRINLSIGPNDRIQYLNMRYFAYDSRLVQNSGFLQIVGINEGISGNNPTTGIPFTINTADSEYRTDTLIVGLSIPVNTLHIINVFSFLLGFGARSADNYGINITADIKDARNINCHVTAHPQTAVQRVRANFFIIDSTGLEFTYSTYLQSGSVYSIDGQQISFFDSIPDSIFSDNYIIGLSSVSMRDAVVYTLSTTDFYFQTPVSSFYNQLTILSFYQADPSYVEPQQSYQTPKAQIGLGVIIAIVLSFAFLFVVVGLLAYWCPLRKKMKGKKREELNKARVQAEGIQNQIASRNREDLKDIDNHFSFNRQNETHQNIDVDQQIVDGPEQKGRIKRNALTKISMAEIQEVVEAQVELNEERQIKQREKQTRK